MIERFYHVKHFPFLIDLDSKTRNPLRLLLKLLLPKSC